MICKECGAEMILDDKDFRFKGNYDNYWCCENCQTSCIEKVRFEQTLEENWHSENDDVKDYTIKHQIKQKARGNNNVQKHTDDQRRQDQSPDGR